MINPLLPRGAVTMIPPVACTETVNCRAFRLANPIDGMTVSMVKTLDGLHTTPETAAQIYNYNRPAPAGSVRAFWHDRKTGQTFGFATAPSDCLPIELPQPAV
jgi:hypothetical protein